MVISWTNCTIPHPVQRRFDSGAGHGAEVERARGRGERRRVVMFVAGHRDRVHGRGAAADEDSLARQLSAGQRKRLSLARLWLSPAPLWLLDEPYANLDLEGLDLVNRMVQAHLREGGAALLTTHGAYAAPPVRTRMLELRRQA